MPRARILIVDDDPDIHPLLRSVLACGDYTIESAYDGLAALEMLPSNRYDLVLCDIYMPQLDGLEFLRRAQQLATETPVIMMTAQHTPDTVVGSIRANACSYFSKPFSAPEVLDLVERALRTKAGPDDIVVLSAKADWISLEVRCKLQVIDRLGPFFRELSVGLSAERRDEIAIAFRELLMNAIEHGGRFDPETKVQVTYIRTSRAILYLLQDPGQGFSFQDLVHAAVSNSPDAPFRHAEVRNELGMRPGGLGILIVRELADELIFNEKGNAVLFVKNL